MAMDEEPELVIQQLEARGRRRRALGAEQLHRLVQQDWRLYGLLTRYRAGESAMEEILTELLPAVDGRSSRYRPVRLYGRDDLAQELSTELIRLARSMPLTRSDFLTRRLMLGAAKRVTRRLEREWCRQLETTLLSDLDGTGEEDEQ